MRTNIDTNVIFAERYCMQKIFMRIGCKQNKLVMIGLT